MKPDLGLDQDQQCKINYKPIKKLTKGEDLSAVLISVKMGIDFGHFFSEIECVLHSGLPLSILFTRNHFFFS